MACFTSWSDQDLSRAWLVARQHDVFVHDRGTPTGAGRVNVDEYLPHSLAAIGPPANVGGGHVNPNPGWERVQKVRTHEHVLAQIEAKILDGELRIE